MKKVLCFVVLFAAACGGGTTKSDDPRCETLCANMDQSSDGHDIKCTSASVSDCLTQCGAKIYGVSTVCGNCLLEDASFDGELEFVASCGSSSPGSSCQSGGGGGTTACQTDESGTQSCTVTMNSVSCTFDPSSSSEVSACYKKLYPTGTVTCDVGFEHDLSDCTDFCTTK